MTKKAIVIGSGIFGLVVTRKMAPPGDKVDVFERQPKAMGASGRNFGMIWPVGQPVGVRDEMALRSRSIRKEMAVVATFKTVAKPFGFGFDLSFKC